MKVKEVNRLLSLSDYPLGAMVIIDVSLQGKPICIVCCCIVRRDQIIQIIQQRWRFDIRRSTNYQQEEEEEGGYEYDLQILRGVTSQEPKADQEGHEETTEQQTTAEYCTAVVPETYKIEK